MSSSAHEGHTVIVTGAGSGIGVEIARRFLDDGATVYAADLEPGGAPDGVRRVRADVSDAGAVRDLVAQVVADTGRLDVLCNNAGTASTTDAIACTPQEWDRVFAVNVRSVYLATKYSLPVMIEGGGGVIVNTASVAGLIGLPDRAAYCASKGAVVSFTKQVAVQYARQGIRCTCVCPGTVDTPWVGRLLDAADDPVAMREQLVARQPLGRLATPGEVADAVRYLASPAAAFVTGIALVIDGGILAG